MKKIVRGVACLTLISSIACAESFYGGGYLGFIKGSEERELNGNTGSRDFSNLDYGAHVGYLLDSNSQLELSFKMLTFDFKDSKFFDEKGTQFGLDYLYLFNLSALQVKPYVGVGLTMNNKEIHIVGVNEDTFDGYGLKFRLGSYYSLTPQLDIGAELHYDSIAWQSIEFEFPGGKQTLDTTSNYYGIGMNINYKF